MLIDKPDSKYEVPMKTQSESPKVNLVRKSIQSQNF